MKVFKVIWEIEILGDNEFNAAKEALKVMRDSDNRSLNFQVTQLGSGEKVTVDLTNV